MKRELLGLSHKDLLYQRLKSVNSLISEYSFPNLYLFRAAHQYEVISGKNIFIKGITYDRHSYIMPTVHPSELDMEMVRDLLTEVDFLFPIDEQWLSFFPEDEFEWSFREGDSDYIYSTEKMSTYRGRNLHNKRNLLYKFTKGYQHEAAPLTESRMDDARQILEEWLAESGQPGEATDYFPCREALDRYEELVLCGGIYYADSEPAGFILGEEINPETFVLHFAKGLTRFKGVYQYMFNNFALILPKQYAFMNLEQDIDQENLRIAKQSYLPDRVCKKMRVRLRQ